MQQLTTEQIIGYDVIVQSTQICVEQIRCWLETGVKGKVFVCANPHSFVIAKTDPLFRESLQSANLLTPDGTGIVLASKIKGGKIRERVTGPDIFEYLSKELNSKANDRYSYFFLGATNETLLTMKAKMAKDYPFINFAGSFSPPFKPRFNDEDNRKMIEVINRANPDILWVGMTAPKQEKWIYLNKSKLNVKFIGAIGAAFDFYSGNVKRPHPLFQKIGLEWLSRLIKEPKRLFKRNFISTPIFLMMVLTDRFNKKRRK
jgi:N-acetylglucosaminyldiphosphoundecaprenol N-acetyl-beta-D-mannosaminyltransferase